MVGGLDMESYCPALRSITIRRRYDIKNNPDVDEVKDNLSDFLSHCHSLEGVTITMNYNDDRYFNVVLEMLLEKLRENSLTKIALFSSLKGRESQMKMETLLAKHASSLRDLHLYGMRMDVLFSSLIMNYIHLGVLDVYISNDHSQMTASLISYLSSAGDLLERLKVGWGWESYNADDLLVSVETCCPKLTHLEFDGCITSSMRYLRLLYEQCSNLQDVSIRGAIVTNNDSRSVLIWVRGSDDDWAVCLSYALRRRQYKKVHLRLKEDYYHPVENLKSLLEPYEIRLENRAPEAALISLLQDLSHLNSLCMKYLNVHHYTDATLTAIMQHVAKSLKELLMEFEDFDLHDDGLKFSDKLMSELIETCQLLERLTMPCYGLESLVVVSKHSSLRSVDLTMIESVTEEMLDGLLLDDKVTWPSSLEEASVRSHSLCYEFNKKKSRHWSKEGLYDDDDDDVSEETRVSLWEGKDRSASLEYAEMKYIYISILLR
eukprot:scaffold12094_cov163-Ochromonas_danica.AAC.1